MKEWAAARKRVQDMKATDPRAADKLNREITVVSIFLRVINIVENWVHFSTKLDRLHE